MDINLKSFLMRRPQAVANIKGSMEHPQIKGEVYFYQFDDGVIVVADVSGLPSPHEKCKSPVFGFHIHEGERCSGNSDDPFADTLGHFNPSGCNHPYHAGDLPPLFGNKGNAFMAVFTDRFSVREIIGKTVVIHSDPDDFKTQPSGNSGRKIACGKITGRK